MHAMSETLRQRKEAKDSRASSSTRREENDSSVSLLREEIHKVSECSDSRALNSSHGEAVLMCRLWKELQHERRSQRASNHPFRHVSLSMQFLSKKVQEPPKAEDARGHPQQHAIYMHGMWHITQHQTNSEDAYGE